MHALTMLHRILSSRCPTMHAKRLTALLAAVEAAISGFKLTLSDLGRGLRGKRVPRVCLLDSARSSDFPLASARGRR